MAKNSICVSRREEGRKSGVSELRENGKGVLKADPRGVHHETLLSGFGSNIFLGCDAIFVLVLVLFIDD